jgi:hypothetical protein
LIDGCARHDLCDELLLLLLVGFLQLLIEHLLIPLLFFAFFLELFGLKMWVLEVLAVDEADQDEE